MCSLTFCLVRLFVFLIVTYFVLKNPKPNVPWEAVVCCVFSHLGNKGKLAGIHSCPLWTVLEDNFMDSRNPTSFFYLWKWQHLWILASVLEESVKLVAPAFSPICSTCKARGLCISTVQVFVSCCGTLLLPSSTRTHFFAQQPAIHLLTPVP